MNTDFGSSSRDNHPTQRHIPSEANDPTELAGLSSYQEWIPAKDELCQSDDQYDQYDEYDQYNFGSWLAEISEETSFDNTQAAESPEYSLPNNPLDISRGSPTSASHSETDVQLAPLYDSNEQPLAIPRKEEETHFPTVELHISKRQKRSASLGHQTADIEEDGRLRRIVRNLKDHENEQRVFGQQQLKAIKDGYA